MYSCSSVNWLSIQTLSNYVVHFRNIIQFRVSIPADLRLVCKLPVKHFFGRPVEVQNGTLISGFCGLACGPDFQLNEAEHECDFTCVVWTCLLVYFVAAVSHVLCFLMFRLTFVLCCLIDVIN